MSSNAKQESENKNQKPRMKVQIDPIKFDMFFEKKGSWRDLVSSEQATEIFNDWHKDFVNDTGVVNTQAVITALRGGKPRDLLPSKARDLCKELLNMDWKPKVKLNVQNTENFTRLKENYGHRILAHGVEDGKGGVSSIVMMCITGKVQAISSYWGALVDGYPNISPVPHGPYFIIYDINLSSEAGSPNNPSCDKITYVLVPCLEVANSLKEKLEEARKLGFIDQRTLEKFQSKIVTYDDLYEICSRRDLEESQQKRKCSSESAAGDPSKKIRRESTFFQAQTTDQIVEPAMLAKPQPQSAPAPQ